MRIACSSTPEGNVYRFYSTDNDTYQTLKPLVPFLLASQADVIVGGEEGHPHLLLRVGPISNDNEAALLRLVEGYLAERGGKPLH